MPPMNTDQSVQLTVSWVLLCKMYLESRELPTGAEQLKQLVQDLCDRNPVTAVPRREISAGAWDA